MDGAAQPPIEAYGAAPPGPDGAAPHEPNEVAAPLEPDEVVPVERLLRLRDSPAWLSATGPPGLDLDSAPVYSTHLKNKPLLCKVKICEKKAQSGHSYFCVIHSGIKWKHRQIKYKCTVDGCTAYRQRGSYCDKHLYEDHRRLRRAPHLRDMCLPKIYAKQEGRCCNSEHACYEVEDGEATPVCPYGQRRVPYDAMQLEHRTPLWQGGQDDEANLQGMCACCHAIKSAREARLRAKLSLE